MYVPDRYRIEDPTVIREFVAAHPFATLVTAVDGTPRATHLPLILDVPEAGDGSWTVVGHLARANPQWEDFDGSLTALAIFGADPHAYVSPRWYGAGRYVPTWNYVSVHVRGVPVVLHDPDDHRAAVRLLTERFEDPAEYSMDALPEDYLQAMIGATVAFRMPVHEADAAFKLNQNRSPEARRGVVEALEQSEDASARAIAALMRERLEQQE